MRDETVAGAPNDLPPAREECLTHCVVASLARRSFRVSLLAVAALSVAVSPALAQHRATLSHGLTSQVRDGRPEVRVLYEGPQAEADRLAKEYGVTVTGRVSGSAVLVGTSAQIDAIAGDRNVKALTEDGRVRGTMAVTTQSTGASQLWKSASGNFGGLTGSGVTVAIIDSGVDRSHPDVARNLIKEVDFTETGEGDQYGHGTHVAGIIAGRGSRVGSESAYVGMAPGAGIISLKVLTADGTGLVSHVLESIDWILKNKDTFNIRVVNISLGQPAGGRSADDPLAKATARLVQAGVTVCASAGNFGKLEDGTPVIGGVVSPGYTPEAITVGTLNTRGTVERSDDGVATYSSRGPVGDPNEPSTWELKPDLVAPGNAIVAAGAAGSFLWENYPAKRVIGPAGGTYLMLSGSSMATAVTSGAVAQLLQAQPRLTPAEVKFALQYTAEPLKGFGLIEQGAGSLNVALAAATVQTRELLDAPSSNQIGGETVEAGHIEFTQRLTADSTIWGSSIVWGSNVPSDSILPSFAIVHSHSIVWGSSVVWGSNVHSDSIVWGSRIDWGSSIVWGS